MTDFKGVELTAQGRASFDPLIKELLEWYSTEGSKITDDDRLFFAIEKRFGDQIVSKICVPQKLSAGACLVTAVKLCREKD